MRREINEVKCAHNAYSALEEFNPYSMDDIKTAFSLIRDWLRGAYDKVPGRMIASLAGALIYFISPIDLVPDCIPGLGFLDDAAILAAVFKLSAADLQAYRLWKHLHPPPMKIGVRPL